MGVGSACEVELDTDLKGFDMANVSAENSQACCHACRGNSRCSFWSFGNGTCFMKTSDAGRTKAVGITSGAAAPPPPPGTGHNISAFATRDSAGKKPLSVFLSYWSASPGYNHEKPNRTVRLSLVGPMPETAVAHRIAPGVADIEATWKGMGSPD